jgi:hypothetical protein
VEADALLNLSQKKQSRIKAKLWANPACAAAGLGQAVQHPVSAEIIVVE